MQKQDPGSSEKGEPEFLAVGQLRRPHGVRGEIYLSTWTDFPERLKRGVEVFAGPQHRSLRIRSSRRAGNELLLAFEEFTTPEQVGQLSNLVLFVPGAALPALPSDEYYLHQLLGIQVVNVETGEVLGRIVEIIETGANDVYVVRPPAQPDFLVPGVPQFVEEIDFEKAEMRVRLLPGLLPAS
jgi:16S rRNA processing protein RimM